MMELREIFANGLKDGLNFFGFVLTILPGVFIIRILSTVEIEKLIKSDSFYTNAIRHGLLLLLAIACFLASIALSQ